MGKLAKEKAQRFDLGTIHIIFMFIFVYPQGGSAQGECSEGPCQLSFEALGLWTMVSE